MDAGKEEVGKGENGAGVNVSLTEDEQSRLKALLGRLQVELDEEKRFESRDQYEISITNGEADLLDRLKEQKYITSPEGYIPHGSNASPKNMTAHGHSMLIKSFRTENNWWPVNLCFKNVTYEVTIPLKDPGITTISTTLIGVAKKLVGKNMTKKKKILNNLSGVFKAGSMTLVLGPPGSGVTTMFKTLSDVLVQSKKSELTGEILYSGYESSEVLVRKFSAYVDQLDINIPTLSVRETLDFAFKCFGGSKSYFGERIDKIFLTSERKRVSMKEVLDELVEYTLRQYGLMNCSETKVGNELIRGCSGGERHRVTTAEMIVGNKPLMFFDQMSTGLDSAATFDICKDLKTVSTNLQNTYVFSLLQPAPEVYNLFDEVLILAEGMILFHDKRENVLPFFESIGYKCPPQKDIADFIQEVTTDLREQYTRDNDKLNVPKNNREIADAWNKSEFSKTKMHELKEQATKEGRTKNQFVELVSTGSSPFCTDFWEDFSFIYQRQKKMFYRNKPYLIARIVQCSVMSLFLGTVFYDLNDDLLEDGAAIQQRYGILFFLCLQSMLAAFALVPFVFETREVFYKQRRSHMHRVFSYVLCAQVVQAPLQVVESFLLATFSFWLSRVVPTSSAAVTVYFGIVLFLFLLNVVIGGLVRGICSLSPNRETAFVFMGITISMTILFSGFIITQDNIPPWFIWIYWISPITYSLRSISLMVFKSDVFSDQETDVALDFFSFQDDVSYIWYGLIFLIAFAIMNLFFITCALALFKYDNTGQRREVVFDETNQPISNSHSPSNGNGKTPTNEVPEKSERLTSSAVGKVLRNAEIKPVTLVFKDLWYTLPVKHKDDVAVSLLNGISGYALPGQMTALMGASGAGKTTLMDVIAGRKTSGTIKGDILVNGKPKTKSFANLMGYVEQMDVHSPHQTVEEAVYFSAKLRQPESMPEAKKKEFVETILNTLDLTPIRNFVVGFKSSGGLSVEQAKRLTIAVELASNPSVLFCDEPTSGLDSRAAEMIMRGIKKVARSGRTVVCTIHQPNRSIFESFDRILLLQKGGRTVYFGELGEHSSTLVSYLESVPGTPKISDERYNPANYMLEVIGAGTSAALKKGVQINYSEEYQKNALKKENDEDINRLSAIKDTSATEEDGLSFKASYWTQQKILLVKAFNSYWRNPIYNVVRSVFMTIMATLWGLTYWMVAKKTGSDFSQSTAVSIIGVLFNSMVFIGAVNLNLSIPPMTQEKGPYIRETASRMYKAFPFVLSFGLVEIPYLLFNCLVFVTIFFFMVGLEASAEIFFSYYLIFFMYVLVMTYFGHMLVSILPNQQVASIVSGLLVSSFALFSGFLIAVEDVAPFWKFMTYIVPTKYALNAMAAVFLFCDCSANDVIGGNCSDSGIGCNLVVTTVAGEPKTVVAWEAIDNIYGFENRFTEDILALVVFAVVFRLLTFVGYAYFAKVRR